MDEMKTLTINGKTYEVTDPDAPVKDVVSQGRSAKYTFTSPGWKRVLNIIRTSGGMVNFGIAQSNPLYMSQAAGVCFSGFVKYKNDTTEDTNPVLYQIYNNIFGSDAGMASPVRITSVRIGYPDPDQEAYDNGTSGDPRVNPINCYLDVKVEFNPGALNQGTISFNMNYAGFADSHNCEAITEETAATDVGIYGEKLIYYPLVLQEGVSLYMPNDRILAKYFNADIIGATYIEAESAELPGYVKAGDGTKSIGIPGLNTGQYGFKTNSAGTNILPAMATNADIDARTSVYKPIVPNNLEYAVKAALCHGKGAWTSDEQVAAQERMGIDNAGRKLDILWKLNEGILYDFVTDTAAGYSKTVPSGGKYVAVESIGGHTEVVDGESVSADVQSVKEQGFNWWDETWELGALNPDNGNLLNDTGCFRSKDYIPVLPSTNYYFCVKTETTGQTIRVVYYDANKAFIKSPGADTNAIKQTPENCYFVKFYSRATEYNGGICINVSNPARNGTYEPYQTKTYTVPEAVRALTGYGWSAGNVYNAIERTESGWQYVQRVGSVNLGNLTWTYSASNKVFYSTGIADTVMPVGTDIEANCICKLYATVTAASQIAQVTDKSISIGYTIASKAINITDTAYTDATAFKAAMGGVMLYYELAEPIITDITDLMADFPDNFSVEAENTIIFENAARLSVPNTVKYLRSLKEVSA